MARLETPTGPAATAEAKEEVLRAKFFPAQEAVPGEATEELEDEGDETGCWEWRTVTAAEVKRRILASKRDTAPGVDMIPWSAHRLLATHWPAYSAILARIFDRCIALGVHPEVYKAARTVVLRKPGKETYTVPGSYRPITLLPTTGKLLEAIIAQRVLRIAESREGVLPAEHYGGRPHRSAEDATLQIQQFICNAHATKREVALLAIDVSGAYNAVRKAPLLADLKRAGWPVQLRRWAASFMEGRRTQLQVGDYCGEQFGSSVGLPQGSPASQLLWLTYSHGLVQCAAPQVADVHRLSIGWVDDWTLVVAAKDPNDAKAYIDAATEQADQWAARHGAVLDAAKSNLLVFQRRGAAEPEGIEATL